MSKRKFKNSKKYNSKIIQFEEHNTPKRLRKRKVEIIPRNLAQEEYIFAIEDNVITFGVGPAGTGKTYLSTLMAIQALKDGEVEKIVITRPAIGVAGEEHGFLPGTLIEKMAPWTKPIIDIFGIYYHPKQIKSMIEDEIIEISPLAFMRGRTFHNSFIIADEFQNCTIEQVKMCLTRIGEGSKMTVTGDLSQHDRGYENNGLKDFLERYKKSNIDNVKVVKFNNSDIERHPIIISILSLYGE